MVRKYTPHDCRTGYMPKVSQFVLSLPAEVITKMAKLQAQFNCCCCCCWCCCCVGLTSCAYWWSIFQWFQRGFQACALAIVQIKTSAQREYQYKRQQYSNNNNNNKCQKLTNWLLKAYLSIQESFRTPKATINKLELKGKEKRRKQTATTTMPITNALSACSLRV